MTLVIGSLQLGFLYGILALGIYVTFRILNIPDLTAEGSFTLGLVLAYERKFSAEIPTISCIAI